MFNINLEKICFSLNDECNHNCDDCYVECQQSIRNQVDIADIEVFLDFLFTHNKSNKRTVDVDFMGGEMSKYSYLATLADVLNNKFEEYGYTIGDVRVTTYSPQSDILVEFCRILNYSSLRYYIIRNLLKSDIDADKRYCDYVVSKCKNVSVSLEHVFMPYQIPQFNELLFICNTIQYVCIDICYPCGVDSGDFTNDDISNVAKIYKDFINTNQICDNFEKKCFLGQINYNANYCTLTDSLLNESKCNPFTKELWLSPKGNIFPCAHLIKHDSFFNHNKVSLVYANPEPFFSNTKNIRYLSSDDINSKCKSCIVRSWCVNCRILPELFELTAHTPIYNHSEKCRRTLEMVHNFINL